MQRCGRQSWAALGLPGHPITPACARLPLSCLFSKPRSSVFQSMLRGPHHSNTSFWVQPTILNGSEEKLNPLLLPSPHNPLEQNQEKLPWHSIVSTIIFTRDGHRLISNVRGV